jgi:gliding motility-associated-like protein
MIFLYSSLLNYKKYQFNILIVFLLSPLLVLCQQQVNGNKNLKPLIENFTSFSKVTNSAYLSQWETENKGAYKQHPEFGIMPFNGPSGDLVEVLEKRQIDYRYFINPNKPSEFFIQQARGDLHYKKDGKWLTIEHHLLNKGNGIFEANRQPEPVGFNTNEKAAYIKTLDGKVNFNQWKLFGIDKENNEVLLAEADWTIYSAGDDGLLITNIFPGIDATLMVMRGAIKTNFIVKSFQFEGYKSLIFKDAFKVIENEANVVLKFENMENEKQGTDRVHLLANERSLLEIGEAVAYPKNSPKDQMYFPSYILKDNNLGIVIPTDWIKQNLLQGLVIIDPLVTSTNTLAQAAITGSRYDAACDNSQYCTFNLSVNTPPNSTIDMVQTSFDYIALGACVMINGGTRFRLIGPPSCTSPNPSTGYVYLCTLNAQGICTGLNIALYDPTPVSPNPVVNDLAACMPTPSCLPQVMNFEMQFSRCAGPSAGCSNTCIGASSPWIVTLSGETVTFTNIAPNQFNVSATSVCAGQNITATSLGSQYGVGPYTTNWSLSPTGIPSVGVGSTAIINFPIAGAYTLYCIITDACGQTSSASKAISITPPPAPPTVTSPISYCQNATGSILTATGSNLEWFTVPVGGSATGAPTPATGIPGTTSYYVQQTVGGCVSSRAQIDVIVNPFPTFGGAALATPASCGVSDGSVTGLTVNGSGTITYEWSNTVPTIISTSTANGNLSNQPAGNYNLTATDANGCSSTYGPVVINSAAAPTGPTVTTPVNYCLGATASALTATGTNLLWYTVPVGGVGNALAPTPSTAIVGSTSYYVSQTINGCESARIQIDVIINNAPSAPIITSPVNICQGAVASVLSATGAALLWYTVPAGGIGSAIAPTPSTTNTGSMSYYVSQTTGGCESQRAEIVVQIYAIPAINGTAVATASSCVISDGAITGLTASGNGLLTYTWTNASSVIVNTSTSTADLNNQPAGTYTLTVTDAIGCSAVSASVPITNVSGPSAPTVTSPLFYCTGVSTNQLTAIGTNLLWYTVPFGGVGSATAPTPASAIVGTVAYYVSQTVLGCESPLAQIDVTITATPAAPNVVSPINLCQSSIASALTAQGTSLLWYSVPIGGIGSSTAPIPSTLSIGTTSYYVSEVNNGCESARAQIDVIINSAPAAPTVISPISYCQGAVASPLTAIGTNLLWYTVPIGGVGISNLTPQTTTAVDTSYYVSQTIAGCESPRSEIIAIINPGVIPTATITSTNTNVCEGELISFSAIVNDAGVNPALQWLLNGNPIPGQTGLNYSTTLLTGTSIISFQVNSTAVCANPVQIISNVINLNITPNVSPSVSIIAEPPVVCIGQPITITANSLFGGTSPNFIFRLNGVTVQQGPSNTYSSIQLNNNDLVSVVMNSDYTCLIGSNTALSNIITIEIALPPIVEATVSKDTIIKGQSTLLIGSAGSSNALYLWEPATYLVCDICQTTNASPEESTTYLLTATDINTGCIGYDTVDVFVTNEFNIFVPTAFSPNLDGVNDDLYVRGIGIKSFTLDIFDRWGAKVFTTSDQSEYWDGNQNDKPVVTGVYTYYLKYEKYDGTFGEDKGNVTLSR